MCGFNTSTDRLQIQIRRERRAFAGFAFLAWRLPHSDFALLGHQGEQSIPQRILGMSVTNETSETSGLYLSSGACGHAREERITKRQPFPTCRVCGKAVNWTLLRETYSPNRSEHLIDQEAGT
jgi:hypothetical protein